MCNFLYIFAAADRTTEAPVWGNVGWDVVINALAFCLGNDMIEKRLSALILGQSKFSQNFI